MRKADVRDDAVAEERADAAARAIDELIGKQEIRRRVLLLQATDGARREDPLDAEGLHAEDVGAVVELAGVQAMPLAVTRQERDALAAQGREHVRPGRIAERR